MSIALKLEILDLEAELAAAQPRERAEIQKTLDGHRAALAAAQERGAAPRAASRVVVVGGDDDEPEPDEPQKCDGCGTVNDDDAVHCKKCGELLDDDDGEPSAEAVQGVLDRALYNFVDRTNGTPLKVSDLAAFDASLRMRNAVARQAVGALVADRARRGIR